MSADQLAGTTADTPNPAWDTIYSIDNPQLMNTYWGWSCDIWPIAAAPFLHTTICTEPDAFSRAGSPAGTAVIRALDVTMGTWLATGFSVRVSP